SEFVDLTQNNTLVTESIDVSYRYYPSLADLQNGTDEITNPGNFEVTATTTEIYVNISAINSDCTDYAVYTITLNESPDAIDGSLENCSIDDISTFHLPDADELVIANPEDYEITYHTTYNNALKDRKSTRLNSSHVKISYAVFCLKKKKQANPHSTEEISRPRVARQAV